MIEWEKKILKNYCNNICELCSKEDRKWGECGQSKKHLDVVKYEIKDFSYEEDIHEYWLQKSLGKRGIK